MALRGNLLATLEDLAPFRDEWDALAVRNSRPYCSPAWMLAWWRWVAEEGALLRAVAVTDRKQRLIGMAPFWVTGRRTLLPRYGLLGAGLAAPIEPLAQLGDEEEVAGAIAPVLAAARPRAAVVALDGVPEGSPWPRLLMEAWPGRRRPSLSCERSRPIPTVDLTSGGYEEWFAARRAHFRQQMRRYRRRIEERGGEFTLPYTPEEVYARLDDFGRLHEARWVGRGGSAALDVRVEKMLAEVAGELTAQGRFRLWCIDSADRTVSAHLFLGAGEEASYWLGGFDREWRSHSPALQTVLVAIEDAFARGERRLDLGPGGQDYKYRLADGESRLDWLLLLPGGPLHPLARGRLAGIELVRSLFGRLPTPVRERMRRWLRRE